MPSGPLILSYSSWTGNCKIWIEIAGPVTPQVYEAVPDEIRGMAAWVIDGCVAGSGGGIGGFVIKDISNLSTYVTEPDTKIPGTYRKCATREVWIQSFRLKFAAIHSSLDCVSNRHDYWLS